MVFLGGEAKGEDGPFGRKSVSVSVRKIFECRISENTDTDTPHRSSFCGQLFLTARLRPA
jgi:hypothetical protein